MNWFKKEEKPAYLKYKRGHIIEKERTEREHLLIENKNQKETNIEDTKDEILTAPPKKKLTMMFGIIGLLVFGLVFFRLIGLYTTNLYGEKDLNAELPTLTLPTLEAPDVAVKIPDVDVDVSLPDVDIQAPSLKEKENGTEDDQTSGNVYAYSAAVHEDLIRSIENIKQTVVRYSNGQANRMTVESRIEKEQLSYNTIIANIDMRLNSGEYVTEQQKNLLQTLKTQVEALKDETATISESPRNSLIDQTNVLIENENNRRNSFLESLMKGLQADSVPYKEIEGQLVF